MCIGMFEGGLGGLQYTGGIRGDRMSLPWCSSASMGGMEEKEHPMETWKYRSLRYD